MSPAHFIRAFEVLQKDLIELFDYIEPSDGNLNCYSYRIHELLTRACIEVEANCRAILTENSYSGSRKLTMTDYSKLEKTHHLSSFSVRLPLWEGARNPRMPYEHWKHGHGLPWYQAYNETKHSRHENFEQSSFGNMLDAVCGLVAILASQFAIIDFGPEHYTGPSSRVAGFDVAIGGYFEVKFPDDWPSSEQYDFDWSRLRNDPSPFENLEFS